MVLDRAKALEQQFICHSASHTADPERNRASSRERMHTPADAMSHAGVARNGGGGGGGGGEGEGSGGGGGGGGGGAAMEQVSSSSAAGKTKSSETGSAAPTAAPQTQTQTQTQTKTQAQTVGEEGALAKQLEALEKKLDKRFRDTSLATAAEVMKIKSECLNEVMKCMNEVIKIKSECLGNAADMVSVADSKLQQRLVELERALATGVEDAKADAAAANAQAHTAGLAAEVVRVLLHQRLEDVDVRMGAHQAQIAENCRQMFLLIEQQLSLLAASEHISNTLATL